MSQKTEATLHQDVPALEGQIEEDSPSTVPYETRIAGTAYESRPSVVAQLRVGEQVQLIREAKNRHDSNAIKAVRKGAKCFGYVNASMAACLAPEMDLSGKPLDAIIKSISATTIPSESRLIIIEFRRPDLP
jgi:hypothetical protein